MAQPVNVIDSTGNKIASIKDADGKVRLAVTGDQDVDLRLDDTTTPNVTYIGKAAIGSATSAAVWQIKKVDETSGLVLTWATGTNAFNHIWDNRASLSYS